MKNFCLTIAGSDPTSGAGIQADIRTFDRCGVHPFSAITAVTYQTATEFVGFKSLSNELGQQLNAIFSAYPIKFVKIGMIPDVKTIDIIVRYIKTYELVAVYDPISTSSAGKRLSSEGLELQIEKDLFPYITILTPNKKEASFYSNKELDNIEDRNELKEAAITILDKLYLSNKEKTKEKAVVIKSAGEYQDEIFDFACIGKIGEGKFFHNFQIFNKKKVSFEGNIHGTGCVFSSAITAFLSKGCGIKKSIRMAEDFFNEKFLRYIILPDHGKVIDLTYSSEQLNVINQIKEIYNFVSDLRKFSKLIPEVRLNISGALPNATKREDVAGVEGRVTVINGFPKASGEIKFGVSDHTARLILTAKEFDKSINFVMNLKYNPKWITLLQEKTDLELQEIIREKQPEKIKSEEYSTMQWLIKESVNKIGKIPDIIWDKGAIGKEPIIRLFGKNSKEMIEKLKIIVNTI